MNFEFKKDRYRVARGAYSRLINLFCRVCGKKLLTYQKDGPGNLRRLYLDRIFSPRNLTNLEVKPIKAISTLTCPKCKEEIGTPYIYQKENRKAFKLYQDALNDILPTLKVAHFVRNPRFARSGVSSYDFIQRPETQSYLYAGCS